MRAVPPCRPFPSAFDRPCVRPGAPADPAALEALHAWRRWCPNLLAKNPTLRVPCPDCSGGHLLVSDTYSAGSDIFECEMSCSTCESHNSIRMRYRDSQAIEVE